MQKTKKRLVGIGGILLVVIMTIVAYFIPANVSANDSFTQTIRVTVYDQKPKVELKKPVAEDIYTSSEIEIGFDYSNSSKIEFTLSFTDGDGNVHEITLPDYVPASLDPTFGYASGSDTVTIDINALVASLGVDGYGYFVLNAKSTSPVGYDEDSVDFYYAPVVVEQTGSDATNSDPIVTVEYDKGVGRVELMPVDENGNPLFDEPVVVEISDTTTGGTKEVSLPFGSYGLESGTYTLVFNAYARTDGGASGDDTYTEIYSPINVTEVSYERPAAPDIPDTGRFLGSLNIAKSDYIMTGMIVFGSALLLAFIVLGRKKKDYRKNYRKR